MHGIAISTDPATFDDSLARLDLVWNFFKSEKLLERGSIFNVNIPLSDKGIRVTRQGGIYFTDEFVCRGGDMYEQEEKFFAFAEKRTPEKIEDWLKTLSHKVLRLDGTKPIQENVELIKSLLLWEKHADFASLDRPSGG